MNLDLNKPPHIGFQMKKAIILLLFTFPLIGTCDAQLNKGQIDFNKIPALRWHYQAEYSFDKTLDPASWARQKPGLHVAFGSTDELYLRSEVPDLNGPAQVWNETGWRGERLNAQVLVWSPDTIDQVRFKVSDLVNSNGNEIRKDRISLKMVRYVLSNFPYAAKDFGCDVSNDSVYLMPDRLESFERFDLPGRSVRPVWLAVDVDPNTEPGEYSGTLEIGSTKNSATLKINIVIQNQVLPGSADWNYRLDLWQNPWVVAEYYQVDPWSAEHKLLLKKHLKHYAEAGGKYITTYAVHSPWSDNSFSLEGTMVEWIKARDGSWQFDFSIFDQYVELAMEAGIDKAITVYTPVPWGHRFRYLDEKSGNYIYEEWSPDSEQFSDTWNIFLDQLRVHLTDRGWFDKTYLGINENPLEYTLAAARVIKENSVDWKITYAGDWHPELSPLLDDYSIIIGQTPSSDQIRERTTRGQTTTFYVCCTPPRPNNFVFSPPVEGRYISWLAAAHGYDGFLRWAYDAWPADPVRDARHTLWPAGDCFLVYPGGNSSIRFEKLREGIVDFEKISILRKLALNSNDRQVQDLVKDFEAHIATFALDPDFNKNEFDTEKMTESLKKGRIWIEKLSNAL